MLHYLMEVDGVGIENVLDMDETFMKILSMPEKGVDKHSEGARSRVFLCPMFCRRV